MRSADLTDATPKHLDYDEPVLRYHSIIAELVADLVPAGGSVLDLGCGPGQTLGEIVDRRPDLNIVGVDGDEECLRRAKERAPSAKLQIDDIQELSSFEPGTFDAVCSSHSLEHLPSPVAALERWSDLLTPTGRLIVAVPNSHQPIFLGLALARNQRVNEGHFYAWDRATFVNFCRLAGFEIERWREDYVPLVPVRWRRRLPVVARLERALLRMVPAFANSHIAVLRPMRA